MIELNVKRFGYYSSILLTLFTVLTFGIAIFTPPLTGPFCEGFCYEYPFSEIVGRFPRDYLWIYPAILMILSYICLMGVIHQAASITNKIYSLLGLSFAIISATVLLSDYFVQIAVIQPSLIKSETEGIAMLTQFNPHGVFIALEELGYLAMSVSFLFIALIFAGRSRLERAIRWIFFMGFGLSVLSLIIISLIFGLQREYRFEVFIISVNFLVLIINGFLLSQVYKKA
jgi:hypothetical protein